MNSTPIEFHKIWIDQCAATEGIRERFGMDDALNYLVGEKLFSFLHAADASLLYQPRRCEKVTLSRSERWRLKIAARLTCL